MEKEVIEKLVNKGLSQRQIAKELSCSQTTVKHWIKKYQLKTVNVKTNYVELKDDEKYCYQCETIKNRSDFYSKHQEGKDLQHQCKFCANKQKVDRGRIVKIKMIEYKGSECEHCSLKLKNSHPAVYDFHHMDPNEKDINFTSVKYWKWEKIVDELDKCNLLCSNCHRIEHARLDNNSLVV
jgi:predicted transcriptional regulator